MAQTVKNLPAMQETWVQSLGHEDPLEKEMATHSSTLTWRVPWRRSLVGYIGFKHCYSRISLMAQTVKNLPAMQETWIQFLGWEDPLKKGVATHSCILA